MNGKYPGVPRFSTPIVDVRDVALAHLRAITVKEAANQRFILVNENLWFKQVADILLGEFEPLGWSFSTWQLWKWLAQVGSVFNNDLAVMMRFWNVATKFENTPSKQVLGIEYRDTKGTLIEMVNSMFETGVLQRKAPINKAKELKK